MIEALGPFAPPLIVGLWGVLGLLAARAGTDARPAALARVVPGLGLGLALAAALAGLSRPELAGEVVAGGALVADRLAALLDALLVAVMLAAVLADPRADDPRAAWCRGLLLLAGAGAMLAVRAGDWPTLIVGVELATLAGGLCLAAGDGSLAGTSAPGDAADEPARDGPPAKRAGPGDAGRGGGPPAASAALVAAAIPDGGRRAARTWLIGQGVGAAILWLGIGLVVAATGTTRLSDLGGRVGAVFLRWGANTAQAAVDVLKAPQELPAGLIAHARDAAVEGMAPAALYVPGALLLLAGLLIRAGVVPLLAGRVAAAGRAGVCGWVATELVVRTAAVAALIRVLVATLNAPRVVYAPYGWGTAAAVIGGAGALLAAIQAARAAELRRLLAWAAATQTGLTVLALAAAGNFVAHAGLRAGGLEIADHYSWGLRAAELAVAAAVAGHVIFALAACGALAAAAAVDAGRGMVDLAGLARRSRLALAALVVCALALAGAPPTGGMAARWWWLSAVLEDSNMLVRASAAAGALAMALVAWACLRPLLVALTPDGAADGRSAPAPGPGRPRRGAVVVAAVLSILLLAAGLSAHVFASMVEDAAAGAGFQPGSKGRREWLSRTGR